MIYVNLKKQPQWLDKIEVSQPTSKPNLCIWWNFKGILRYELFPINPGEVCSTLLERLDRALREKKPALINQKGVVFHHDNARITAEKLRQLGWEVLPQLAYSPDVASTDYHLFRSLQKFLVGEYLSNEEYVKNALAEFFKSKSQ